MRIPLFSQKPMTSMEQECAKIKKISDVDEKIKAITSLIGEVGSRKLIVGDSTVQLSSKDDKTFKIFFNQFTRDSKLSVKQASTLMTAIDSNQILTSKHRATFKHQILMNEVLDNPTSAVVEKRNELAQIQTKIKSCRRNKKVFSFLRKATTSVSIGTGAVGIGLAMFGLIPASGALLAISGVFWGAHLSALKEQKLAMDSLNELRKEAETTSDDLEKLMKNEVPQ